jgi:hypothetical protein
MWSLESGLRSKDSWVRSEGGRWKSTHRGNSLAAYPTARPVRRGLRHEVTYVFVMTDNAQYITRCSTIGILPRQAHGAIRRSEALGTMYPSPQRGGHETARNKDDC